MVTPTSAAGFTVPNTVAELFVCDGSVVVLVTAAVSTIEAGVAFPGVHDGALALPEGEQTACESAGAQHEVHEPAEARSAALCKDDVETRGAAAAAEDRVYERSAAASPGHGPGIAGVAPTEHDSGDGGGLAERGSATKHPSFCQKSYHFSSIAGGS